MNERPYTLVAELTYRCPLRCVYCSNPVELTRQDRELDTATWRRVFREAEALGVVQLNLSGGEPLLRADLEDLVEEARALRLYTNLITSGMPLDQGRLSALAARGLDAVQLSLQDPRPEAAERIAGKDALAAKLEVAAWVRAAGLPLTINVVLHRDNIDRIDEIVALAERLGAERLELANTQYLGWALVNREALLPTRAALEQARAAAERAQKRLRGRIEVLFVLPDYQADRPRACMDGWARRFIVVAPDGTMLPCHQAHTIRTLHFENVSARSVGDIWRDSPAFNAFRGQAWMPEPCRSCERRTIDFGG
ncbi:MAG TPA: pyrroloquinoline quinone biosynthesis protein PqqE, partial [Polyangia bacterium]|nr:pyrroloquinoline quinone biosynthesis protein PqqE [Polyangia bacterium]